jgi:preprotein translocase subunit SecB
MQSAGHVAAWRGACYRAAGNNRKEIDPMSTPGAPEGAAGESPHIRVLAQYVKDLSFENPTAASGTQANEVAPSIDMGIDVNARPLGGEGEQAFEVDLRIAAKATRGDDVMFITELVYSGVFQFVNVAGDDVEPLLLIECPRLLFPFSRRLLAEITREGGYPPLLIDPIDFAALYRAQLRDRQAQAAN